MASRRRWSRSLQVISSTSLEGTSSGCKDKETLRHYGLDGQPPIVNLQGLNDPNSPIGRMLLSQDEGARRGAMETMEKQVIRLATAKTGPVLMPEQLEPEEAA